MVTLGYVNNTSNVFFTNLPIIRPREVTSVDSWGKGRGGLETSRAGGVLALE